MATEGFNLGNIQQFVGKEIGVSDWDLIDQKRIDMFAASTGDHQWIHVDVERAKRESPVGTTIAHGYLTLAQLAGSTAELVAKPLGAKQVLNYGLEKVRFLAPVKSGARVRNRIKLVSAEDKGSGRTLIAIENTVEIEGEPKPAMFAIALVMAIG